jgi:hypothetical protein
MQNTDSDVRTTGSEELTPETGCVAFVEVATELASSRSDANAGGA